MKKNKRTAYFVGSFEGKKLYDKNFQKIAKVVSDYGYTLFDDINHITFKDARKRSEREVERYWKNEAVKKINKADIFIGEITEKSTSIGIEIGMAVSNYKPTLLLQSDNKTSPPPIPLRALKSKVTVKSYNLKNVEQKITTWLKRVDKGIITKFMNIGFSKEQVDLIEFIQETENIKSFALTVRSIINGEINIPEKHLEFQRKNN